MLSVNLLWYALAATPALSAEVGIRNLSHGEARQFAAVRLIEPIYGFNTFVEVAGEREMVFGDAKALLRLGVQSAKWQVKVTAVRTGNSFSPSGEVRVTLLPRVTVFAEGTTGVSASQLRVGARYASERITWTVEGNSRGDASMVVSLSLI